MGQEGREEGTNGKADRKREGSVEGKAVLGGLHFTQKRESRDGQEGSCVGSAALRRGRNGVEEGPWVGSTALGTLCVVTPASHLI